MKFIDLCCGIGGFHQALSMMNMTCVFASDIDEKCRINYEINYNIKPHGDLTEINIQEIPSFNVLCAGFPCQPFSKAGQKNGFNDSRGNIFFEICKIIQFHKPEYIIFENVKNLASHDNGNTWNVIKSTLKDLNYNIYDNPLILNTLYFAVPQSRERIVILCKRKDIGPLPLLPTINKNNIKPTSLSSIIDTQNVDEKYTIKGKLHVTHNIWDNFLQILNNNKIHVPKFPIWTECWTNNVDDNFYIKYKKWIDKNRLFYTTYQNILEHWLTESRNNPLWKGALRKMEWQTNIIDQKMDNVLWSPRGSGVRIKNTDYSPTLVAMTSMIPIYGPLKRKLTPRECARLQCFPENYIIDNNDSNAYKQFGNAVNVTMINRCARMLIGNEQLFD